MILEKMMEVFDRYSNYKDKKSNVRTKNRVSHDPKVTREFS